MLERSLLLHEFSMHHLLTEITLAWVTIKLQNELVECSPEGEMVAGS